MVSPRSALRLASLAALLSGLLGLPYLLHAWQGGNFLDSESGGLTAWVLWLAAHRELDLALGLILAGGLALASRGEARLRRASITTLLMTALSGTFVVLAHLQVDVEGLRPVGLIMGPALLGVRDFALWRAAGHGRPQDRWVQGAGLVLGAYFVLLLLSRWEVDLGYTYLIVGSLHEVAIAVLLGRMAAQVVDLQGYYSASTGLGAPEAAAGLRTFRMLLVFRLGTAVVAAGAGVWAGSKQDLDLTKFVLYGGTVASMGIGLLMLGALLRFVSATPGGASAARVTVATLGIGLALDGWAFSLLGDLFGGGVGSAFAAADRLPWISGLAQLTGLIGLVALVSACRSVAVVAGDEALANDAARAGVWVASVVAVSVVVQALAAVRDVPPGVLLLAGVVALVTALGMLAVLLGLLRRTADVLG